MEASRPRALRVLRVLPKALSTVLDGTQTHFARVSLVPPWLTDVGQRHPDELGTPYLLFSSDFWGNRYRYLEQVRKRLV